ncbi:putative exported protein, partial [Plasmodium gaboni]
KIEKLKNESIIYNIYLNIKYYLIEFRNDVIDIELKCPKYFQDLFKKKKGKRKTFFELWMLFNEIMEEKVRKYQIGGYTMGLGIFSGIAKSIHSLIPAPLLSAKKVCTACLISPDPATKVIAIIIIIILFIILIVYLYFLIKKSGILENEKVQKVISKLKSYYKS